MAYVDEAERELSGYESESDDSALRPLTMRRRGPSDDDGEGEDSGDSGDRERRFGADRTVGVCSEGESSDGLGGAPSEDDGEEEWRTDEGSEFEDEGDQYGEADLAELIVDRYFGADRSRMVGACSKGESPDGYGGVPPESDGESCTDEGIVFDDEGGGVLESVLEGVHTAPVMEVFDEKKKNERTEPYVIPTVGAFYMHDDRFRRNCGRRRNSQKCGGRNLWQFKDDSKWGHDKFEELTLQDSHSKEVKEETTTKIRNQVRSINQCGDRCSNGEKSRRNVKGRGPVKYRAYRPITGSFNLYRPAKDNLTGRYLEKKSNTASAREHTSNSSSMPSTYYTKCSQSIVQRGLPSAQYESAPYCNEFYRACSQAQQPVVQQWPAKSKCQPSLQATTKHWGLSYGSGSQASHIALSPYSFECAEIKSLLGPGPRPSISSFAPDGNQGITHGSGTSSISYGGTQFDHNYPATPFPGPHPSMTEFAPAGNREGNTQGSETSSILCGGTQFNHNYPANPFPVVHFGGQHHGDLGVPAVIPGYTAPSQLGSGNSDITCNKRRAKEFTRGIKTPYKPELVNEEYWQQQIKPQRYSKMNFNK